MKDVCLWKKTKLSVVEVFYLKQKAQCMNIFVDCIRKRKDGKTGAFWV